MPSINKAFLLGHVGHTPKLSQTRSGQQADSRLTGDISNHLPRRRHQRAAHRVAQRGRLRPSGRKRVRLCPERQLAVG